MRYKRRKRHVNAYVWTFNAISLRYEQIWAPTYEMVETFLWVFDFLPIFFVLTKSILEVLDIGLAESNYWRVQVGKAYDLVGNVYIYILTYLYPWIGLWFHRWQTEIPLSRNIYFDLGEIGENVAVWFGGKGKDECQTKLRVEISKNWQRNPICQISKCIRKKRFISDYDFYDFNLDARSCLTCDKVLAELEKIDDDTDSFGVDFVKINDKRLAKQYGIKNFPALTYFR